VAALQGVALRGRILIRIATVQAHPPTKDNLAIGQGLRPAGAQECWWGHNGFKPGGLLMVKDGIVVPNSLSKLAALNLEQFVEGRM
jgi:hypothetical protein